MLQIIYYRKTCIGCAACAEIAPDRWRMSRKDGKSTLLGSTEKKGVFQARVSMLELEQNQKAEANCPVKVIQIRY